MKKLLLVLLVSVAFAKSKDDLIKVEVVNSHTVTHEDQSNRATINKALLGPHSPTQQIESFNLDTVINGERVILACDDPKGCESPAKGTYDGELKRNKWVKMTFVVPLSRKRVTRWYKIAGSWEPSAALRDSQ